MFSISIFPFFATRYIYKLHDLHLNAENFNEAGFTLKLYADMLSWDNDTLTFLPHDNNGQPEWKRKEKLYHQIINYFDKGKCWEKGVPLCKELATFYETTLYDYKKLSDTLITEANFFQNILTQIRPEPEYFRVGFFGKGFPLFVRNKQFIYRGLEYERIGAFTQRLQTEFASAQLYTKNSPPDAAIMNSNEQYCQISTVRPLSDINHLMSASNVISDKISRFYEVNDIRRFQHDRPLHKGTIDKNNEFKSLWIERTLIEISEPLPNILRWLEIKRQTVIELPPIEVACETLSNTMKELEELMNQYKLDSNKNLNPFTMRLKGTIDANVQGGIPKYQEAFLSESYLSMVEAKDYHVQKLRALIVNMMQVLDSALELHGRLAPSEVQPLHKLLVERFNEFRDNLNFWGKARRQKSESIINQPLPAIPVTTQRSVDYEPDSEEHYTQMKHYNGSANRKSLDLSEIQSCISSVQAPPPRPVKGNSMDYTNMNTPDIPPKTYSSISSASSAPPLPPRYTPDKRMSNPLYCESPGDGPRRNPRIPYSVVSLPIPYDSEIETETESELMVQRDSGISTNSQNEANNNGYATTCGVYSRPLNVPGHKKNSSNPEDFNYQTNSEESSPAPALPPKTFVSNPGYEGGEECFSDSTSESLPLPPIPQIQQHFANENGNVPCCELDVNVKTLPCCLPNAIVDEEECFCSNPPPTPPQTNQSCC